jgi:hypothetical protein
MTDWDAIFGEAALGLDLAKVDHARGGLGHMLFRRERRSSVQARLDPRRDPASPGARPLRTGPPSLRLTSRPTGPTTDRDAIFRQEALEFRARGRDATGGVVRLGGWPIRWVYRMTIVLVAAAVASLWLIRTNESSSGPAVVDGRTGTVAALLPAAIGPDLASSQELTVTLPGGRSVRVSVQNAQLAGDTAIRKAGLVPTDQPAILVTGRLYPDTSGGPVAQDTQLQTQASIVLRSEPLADILARQFDAMLGQEAAP